LDLEKNPEYQGYAKMIQRIEQERTEKDKIKEELGVN
jgi:hypothetical protein